MLQHLVSRSLLFSVITNSKEMYGIMPAPFDASTKCAQRSTVSLLRRSCQYAFVIQIVQE